MQDEGVGILSLRSLEINLPLPAVITAKRPIGTVTDTMWLKIQTAALEVSVRAIEAQRREGPIY